MKELTGIKSNLKLNFESISEIKRYLLLFDSVGIINLEKIISGIRQKHNHLHMCEKLLFVAELENLIGNKLLLNIELKGGGIIRNDAATPENIKKFNSLLESSQKLFLDTGVDEDVKFDAFNRLQSFIMNIEQPPLRFEAIPIVRQFNLPSNISTTKSDVINLVIHQFPFPQDSVPWEKILEFKSDKDNIGRLAGLRSWISSLSKSGMSVNEINDELQYKIYVHQKTLEAHKIKYKTGMLETFIVGGAELLENVLKLNLKDVAKTFFKAKELKADLLLAEVNTPGHELGYIYRVNEEFR